MIADAAVVAAAAVATAAGLVAAALVAAAVAAAVTSICCSEPGNASDIPTDRIHADVIDLQR